MGETKSVASRYGAISDEDAEARRSEFLAGLRRTGSVSISAAAAGVSRSNAYLWKKRHREFAAEWDDIIQSFIDAVEGKGIELALAGDPSMIRFFLQSWRRERYAPEMNLKVRDVQPRHRFIGFDGRDLFTGELFESSTDQGMHHGDTSDFDDTVVDE